MSNHVSAILIHVVFSTKSRREFLFPEIKGLMFAYIRGILEEQGITVLRINGMSDHVHILMGLPVDRALSDLMREVKSSSSKWFRQKHPDFSHFAWQRGYSAFSVCADRTDRVAAYIQNQEEHHKRWSYKEELDKFLARWSFVLDQ